MPKLPPSKDTRPRIRRKVTKIDHENSSAGKTTSSIQRSAQTNVISRRKGKKGEIAVFKRLNWTTASIISSEIFKLINQGAEKITINMQKLIEADEKGVIPLAAFCDANRKNGHQFYFLWPTDHNLQAIFKNHGWSAYLTGDTPSKKRRLPRTTGMIRFDSHEDLNTKMNEAIAVCIKGTVFNNNALKSFEWAFSEILDNVLTHSGAGYGYFEVTWGMSGKVSFTVCDCGVGIPKNIRNAFKEVNSDHDALAKAIEKGITSTREGQGNGLAGTINIVHSASGSLTINSGFGTLNIKDQEITSRRLAIPFRGTFVNFMLPSNTEVDFEKALWGFDAYSFIEYNFDSNDGDGLTFRLKDHGERFGNRPTGKALRNMLLNILAAHPNRKVTVDFEGVEVISSSFGDEFLGKIASEKGIVYFTQAINLRGLSTFIAGILNHVIAQRLYQDFARSKNLPLSSD